MPLPIIPDVYQVRLNWNNTSAPRDASNNLYFLDSAGTQTVANLNTDFQASAAQAMWGIVATPGVVNRLTITPLDGVTAGSVFDTGSGTKWQGAGGTDAILQGAMVISLKSATRGPSGRGRVYLPWVPESAQANGVITPSVVTGHTAAWVAFYVAMNAAAWMPVVVSSTQNQAHEIVNIGAKPYVMTQRRRARR